jgi:4-diphosphocytidyl-2-C-methyl-D-erythritol kinase
MKTISGKAHTRVTLALDIVRKIDSGPLAGYHELSIVKHQISLFDLITVRDAEVTSVSCGHPLVPLDNTNICIRALDAVKKYTGIDKNAEIIIEKNIPVMGGLAGGSANAATTLQLVNSLWNLGLSGKRMAEIGRTLGMDVPYFFTGYTAFDTEATGVPEKISTNLDLKMILAIPDFGVSTKEAYANIDYGITGKNISMTKAMKAALAQNDFSGVIENMHNDFELSVFLRNPELGLIRQRLIDCGCLNAILSGSGSTVIGIIDDSTDVDKIRNCAGCKTVIVSGTFF